MQKQEFYMQKCLELAYKGIGNVSPNHMVGSVIVYNNEIIGKGYHQQYGLSHAEANAIASVKNKELLSKSILYVNLEPCAHFGKTPPCANLIIKYKIPQVVIGCIDPSSKVSGKGIQKMQNAGIKVTVGVLEKDSKEINKRFFIFNKKKRPYIILKWAKSKNISMAVCTNKQERLAVDLLKKLKMYDYFEYIAGSDTFSFNTPDPRHLTNVVEIIQGDIKKTIMIGDSETDANEERGAGITIIL